MKITDALINKLNAEWWQSEHPGDDAPPADVANRINERTRALYVLQATAGTMKPTQAMSLYMVRDDIAAEILAKYAGVRELEPAKKKSPRGKYSEFFQWCEENVLGQHSTQQLADIAGVSYPTVLKIISGRPDIFRKVSRGVFEIRDPKADRQRS